MGAALAAGLGEAGFGVGEGGLGLGEPPRPCESPTSHMVRSNYLFAKKLCTCGECHRLACTAEYANCSNRHFYKHPGLKSSK